MFERFTAEARAVVVEALEQARALGHTQIRAEHLLLGVIADADSLASGVLRDAGLQREALLRELAVLGDADADALHSIGVDLAAVRRQAEATFGPGALEQPVVRRRGLFRRPVLVGGRLPFTTPAKRALEQSLRQALALKHNYIGTGHVLLGLLADDRDPAAVALHRLGVAPGAVRGRVRAELRGAT